MLNEVQQAAGAEARGWAEAELALLDIFCRPASSCVHLLFPAAKHYESNLLEFNSHDLRLHDNSRPNDTYSETYDQLHGRFDEPTNTL